MLKGACDLATLDFDVRLHELLQEYSLRGGDRVWPDIQKRLIEMILSGRPIPYQARELACKAIAKSDPVSLDKKQKGANWQTVGQFVEDDLVRQGCYEPEALTSEDRKRLALNPPKENIGPAHERAAEAFGISKRTVERRWAEWREAKKEDSRLRREYAQAELEEAFREIQ